MAVDANVAAGVVALSSQRAATSQEQFESFGAERADVLLKRIDEPVWHFWRRPVRDPELRKVLGRIHLAVITALRLNAGDGDRLGDDGRKLFRQLLTIDLNDLNVDSALEVVDSLDQLLIEHGDETYLRSTLAVEIVRDRIDTAVTTWSQAFHEQPPKDEVAGIDTGRNFDEAELEAIRNQLAALYRTRSVLYDLRRARQAMKTRHLLLLAPVLLVLVAAFGAASYWEGEQLVSIALVMVAGALGAILSGTLKLRDQVENINDLRSFWPSLLVQPLIGAAAGLVLLVGLDSRLIDVSFGGSGWATRGVIAFVAGFSEPFFLGIVGRVASIGEDQVSKPSQQ